MTRTLFWLTLLAIVPLLAVSPANAQDAHGAITFGRYDKDRSVAYGFAWNYSGKEDANVAAMKECSSSGGTDCKQLVWFQNGCGALAMDRYGNAQGKTAMDRKRAEARALQTCEAAGGSGCAIVGSQCAASGGQARTWSGSETVLTAAGPAQRQSADAGKADAPLTRDQRIRVQRSLDALGFVAGPADGMFGPRTRSAIRKWQEAKGLAATGYLTRNEADALAGAMPAEKMAQRGSSAPVVKQKLDPKCGNGVLGTRCWRQLSNKPSCFIAHYEITYASHFKIEWSGDCLNKVPHGRGTLTISSPRSVFPRDGAGTGQMVHGKRQGRWVFHSGNMLSGWYGGRSAPPGSKVVGEGHFVDDIPQGPWFIRIDNKIAVRGVYKVGKRESGDIVYRYDNGEIKAYHHYVDGKMHGRSISRRIPKHDTDYHYSWRESRVVKGKSHGVVTIVERRIYRDRYDERPWILEKKRCRQNYEHGVRKDRKKGWNRYEENCDKKKINLGTDGHWRNDPARIRKLLYWQEDSKLMAEIERLMSRDASSTRSHHRSGRTQTKHKQKR